MNGKRITQQAIQYSLNFLLKDNGGNTMNITSTKSRIAAATHIAKSNLEKSQIVADLMGHEPCTANEYYREMEGGDHLKRAYEAIKPIQHMLTQNCKWYIEVDYSVVEYYNSKYVYVFR